jgi:DNA-binding LytR/AlgR family response regulator
MEIKKYNCLVVDDEPIARKIVTNYIEQVPFLQLTAEHINALSAIDYLRTHTDVDIIFLDINMPNLSGLQLLKILHPHQPVIFTTAYSEHAVESYELNAVDYLLKPFSFERFTKAVYKAIDLIKITNKKIEAIADERKDVFFIKSDGKNYPVLLDDILYCEAMKNYTMVVLQNEKKLMPLISLSKFETLLAEAGGEFIQVHRSFIVSRKHITAIGPNNVTIKKFDIPIGVQFKEEFFKRIGMKSNE